MVARFIPIGEPAHDAERQALRMLVDGLPDTFTVYGNPWLVDRGGPIYEVDAVVVAPHAFFVVEIKSYRGVIEGNDHDWRVPQPIRSPLKLNRKTAQVLASMLRARSVDASRPFVEGFVFLSHASESKVRGPASAERVHTRRTILGALQDPAALWRRESRRPPVDEHAARILDEILRQGAEGSRKAVRAIREWKIEAPVERTERFAEYFATHAITGEPAVLRVYDVDPLDDDAKRARREELFRWEAQVLRRIGEHESILHARAPIIEEAGYVLPFEAFPGITLTSWIDRHGPKLTGPQGVAAKVALWKLIARALDAAHRQGVVHRILRPDVVLVEDTVDTPKVRVTGFELAKQLHLPGQSVHISTLSDDRRRYSAPEVVRAFSDADARSDQFSLGALLGWILAGHPLFESTDELMRRQGTHTRLRDVNPSLKQSLDDAVARMLQLAAAKRFPSLEEAIAAVDAAITTKTVAPAPLDPDDLPPGTRFGNEFEILSTLGAGGMATVYAARHLVSGKSQALKIARRDPRAEDALRAEFRVLEAMHHTNIVSCRSITSIVPDRVTLVLDQVKGESLARRLVRSASGDAPISDAERRQWSEHLLGALAYLEQHERVHKDIKPDNLVVGPDGLTLIDFSLGEVTTEDTLVGTALYRDPALQRWSPVADRYASALCLFELYAGRHAFGMEVPVPHEAPVIDPLELERPGLAKFFETALSPQPTRRHPSAAAMRSALAEALGSKPGVSAPPPSGAVLPSAASAPLSATPLSGTALASLRRAGIMTQGALVAMPEATLRALPGLGTKKRDEVLALRSHLEAAGVSGGEAPRSERHPLVPSRLGDETPIHRMPQIPRATLDTLARAGLATVGRVADATRAELQKLGLQPKTIAQLVHALQSFGETPTTAPSTLEGMWELAARPLDVPQREAMERLSGLVGRRVTQMELEKETGRPQPSISQSRLRALDVVDRQVLSDALEHVESTLITAGGILRLDEAAARLIERWPSEGTLDPCGFVRLLAEVEPTRLAVRDVLDELTGDVLVRPMFDRATLRTFLETARTLAHWPPTKPDVARDTLQRFLPEFPLDPVGLAVRLERDLRLTEEGELYATPVDLEQAVQHVLHRARLPLHVDDLRRSLLASFGEALVSPPEPHELTLILARTPGVQLDPGTQVVDRATGKSITQNSTVAADPLPTEIGKTATEVALERLRSLSERDGYRVVVVPPEHHAELSRNVAAALPGATFVSFEEAMFTRCGLEDLERGERFLAARPKVVRTLQGVLDDLVAEHGQSGRTVVLGDVAGWLAADAVGLARRLYEQTGTGGRGFWILVAPGLLSASQPLFQERPGAIVFCLPGTAIALSEPLPIA